MLRCEFVFVIVGCVSELKIFWGASEKEGERLTDLAAFSSPSKKFPPFRF